RAFLVSSWRRRTPFFLFFFTAIPIRFPSHLLFIIVLSSSYQLRFWKRERERESSWVQSFLVSFSGSLAIDRSMGIKVIVQQIFDCEYPISTHHHQSRYGITTSCIPDVWRPYRK